MNEGSSLDWRPTRTFWWKRTRPPRQCRYSTSSWRPTRTFGWLRARTTSLHRTQPPTCKEPPDRLTTLVQVGTLIVFNFIIFITHNLSVFVEMFMTHNPSLFVEMFMTHNPSLVVEIFINLNPAKTKITLKSLCKTYSISCTLSKLFTKTSNF